MISYWLFKLLKAIKWLLVPPPPIAVSRLDPDLKCPVCGEEHGRLRCVNRIKINNGRPEQLVTLCEHTCLQCGARYYEKPIVDVNPAMVFPAVPRNKIEKLADDQAKDDYFRQVEGGNNGRLAN